MPLPFFMKIRKKSIHLQDTPTGGNMGMLEPPVAGS